MTGESKSMMRNMAQLGALLIVAMAAVAATATTASGAFSITGFTASETSSVAGAHPDLTTTLTFATSSSPAPLHTDGNVRDLTVELPPGLIGDPTSLPKCAQVEFISGDCPAASQVGTVTSQLVQPSGFTFSPTLSVFNMEPRNDEETAELAFTANGLVIVYISFSVRTDSDYGLTAHITGTTRLFGLAKAVLTIWGVPGDPSHDAQRVDMRLNPVGHSQLSRTPFFTNPTSCNGPLTFRASANSYQALDVFSHATTDLPGITGCEGVSFQPDFTFEPASTEAGAPSGYHSVLTVPENKNPDGRATAALRNTTITLPSGVAINPSGAVGLDGCDDAHLHIGSTVAADCPGASQIGDLRIDVPALPKPIDGHIYLRPPLPGNLFRLVLVADGFGVHLKIPGEVHPDPITGQLTATFPDSPQVPFTKLTLDFEGGPHAALVNPAACGTYTTRAAFTPWSSRNAVTVNSVFTINQNCGREGSFKPGFSAGLTNPGAGTHSGFHLRVTRDAGSAISGVETVLPPGLLANIKSVPRCAEAQAATGTCGVESLIGHTIVGAGAGSDPVFLPQAGKAPTAVYLAGPYKDAPFSLSIVVPAQAGPFDLGTVVVRAGVYVDPVTAQVTVRADPLPTILQGVPLNIRDIRVDIDRPGFTFSPTNCAPMAVTGTITSAAGQAVRVSSPFQVANCRDLDLSPDLDLTLSGKGQTNDGKHPALQAILTQPAGQSNLKQVKVTLPPSLALDPTNSQSSALCEFVDGRKTIPECPKSSIVGTATANTPILDRPLTGPVYFVKNVRTDPKSGRQIRTLPTLATVLQGEGVTLVLRATSSVDDNDQLVTTFANIPDAPVSSFKLDINGGKKGILVISDADICKATQILDQVTDGQNGSTRDAKVTITTPSCPLAVVGSSHTSSALKVKVGGLGAGKVSVSGSGLVKASRTIAESTVATMSLPLSKPMRDVLAHGRNVRVRVSVSFTPKGSKNVKRTGKTLVIHGATK